MDRTRIKKSRRIGSLRRWNLTIALYCHRISDAETEIDISRGIELLSEKEAKYMPELGLRKTVKNILKSFGYQARDIKGAISRAFKGQTAINRQNEETSINLL